MIKVMFICHGNICRSPMAEFILKDMVKRRGIADDFVIASSATSTEEIWGDVGNPVYPPARRELAAHGITCGDKRAVQLRKSDYARYDYLLCMDNSNLRNAMRIIGSDKDGKLRLLLSFADIWDINKISLLNLRAGIICFWISEPNRGCQRFRRCCNLRL